MPPPPHDVEHNARQTSHSPNLASNHSNSRSRSRSRQTSTSNGNAHSSGNGNASGSQIQQEREAPREDSPYSLNGSASLPASASASASPSSPIPYRYPSPYPFPRNPNPDTSNSASNPNTTTNTTSSPISPSNANAGPSTYSYNTNPRRLSKDSEGYPSWLPRRPPPPAPASTLGQASYMGALLPEQSRTGTPGGAGTGTPSPVDPYSDGLIDVGPVNEFGELGYGSIDPFAAYGHGARAGIGRQPTPRSVRIVSLDSDVLPLPGITQPVEDTDFGFGNIDVGNEFGIAVAKRHNEDKNVRGGGGSASQSREPTDQTRVGIEFSEPLHGRGNGNGTPTLPSGPTQPGKARSKPLVFSRASLPPGAFIPAGLGLGTYANQLQLQQPRFNAKSLHLQILRSPSRWMKLYWYLWPLLVLYHVPLQTYLDFGAVYVLIQ
ncbi:hypothetical protein D9613_009248 [Agrocybe pediades]|uniref:Uncharacterized protein n=1 Tax=Agrocybe pediades TaxID=84607 RepID=A0A8H4R471_9AGAR|nr:hypothetical protein D9613_009248 [Agrocybe pediades]